MKIFVLNRGSSSIKCYLYDITHSKPVDPLWKAHLQWKNNFEKATLTIRSRKGNHSESVRGGTPAEVLKQLTKFLFQGKTAVLHSLDEIGAIGHRIVHGGKYFKESVLIDAKVKQKIRLLSDLAPLHNLPELEGIEILQKLFKKTPQIAVFDTAFHHALAEAAKIYPGPYQWYKEGIQRYGFHGISFQYCSKRAADILKLDPGKMVICHLGSGASLGAVKKGKSVDTTMGFTPLEGLMMDTRSGSIDPGIILHLIMKKKKSASKMARELYDKSGLLGVSGISSDMRDIIAKSIKGNVRAAIALKVYLHRLNAHIGAMVAGLKGLDTLVFTAGIGENAPLVREKVCEAFSFLGLKLNKIKNEQTSTEDRELSTPDSKVKVLLIHTQEAFEIACECWKISKNKV